MEYHYKVYSSTDKLYFAACPTYGKGAIDPSSIKMFNPDTFDENYFKDFKIYDKDGYLLASSDERLIPIRMEKYISFKRVEINSVGTEQDYTKFNITFDKLNFDVS